MEEIVNSTPVMLVYPKATSKTLGILVVFQHENKGKPWLHFIWMVSCNGPSYFPEGQVYLAWLTRQGKAFANILQIAWTSFGMLALRWYQFSWFLSRPNGNFFNARKILQIRWLKIHMNLINLLQSSGSLLTSGVFRYFFCILQNPKIRKPSSNPKWRCFTFGSCGWMSSLSSAPGSFIPSIPTKEPASN